MTGLDWAPHHRPLRDPVGRDPCEGIGIGARQGDPNSMSLTEKHRRGMEAEGHRHHLPGRHGFGIGLFEGVIRPGKDIGWLLLRDQGLFQVDKISPEMQLSHTSFFLPLNYLLTYHHELLRKMESRRL